MLWGRNQAERLPCLYTFLQKRKLTRVIQGFPATSIHGDRLQSEREQVLYCPYYFVTPFTRLNGKISLEGLLMTYSPGFGRLQDWQDANPGGNCCRRQRARHSQRDARCQVCDLLFLFIM